MSGQKKVLLKIIILGNSGVGKTALLHKYVQGQFIEEHKATIGADFLTKELAVDDKLITLQIWDTAGQERFQSLGTAFYRGADACVLVYDITSEESFRQIEQWRTNFLEQADPEDGNNFPFLLLGNKSDLSSKRVVPNGDGEALANRYRMTFFETSALNGNNVEKAIISISASASEMETVPYFTDEVADLILDDKLDGDDDKANDSTCACNLL